MSQTYLLAGIFNHYVLSIVAYGPDNIIFTLSEFLTLDLAGFFPKRQQVSLFFQN